MPSNNGKSSKPLWWTIISFIIGTLLGSGAIWQYLNLQLEESRLELETAQTTVDLRKKITDMQYDLIEVSDEYIVATNLYAAQPSSQHQNEKTRLLSRVKTMRDDINAAEVKLAAIEGRAPRKIQLDFIPPAAIGGFQ